MNVSEFETKLRDDGYIEIETKDLVPKPANDQHGHHFAVRGLVLAGTFIVKQGDQSTTYKPGDVFAVADGQLHSEEVGAEGARVLVGRKY